MRSNDGVLTWLSCLRFRRQFNILLMFVFLGVPFHGLAKTEPGSSQAAEQAYDELYMDKAKQKLRPYYHAIRETLHKMLDPQVRAQFAVDFRKAFRGDNAGSSVPRIIDGQEYDEVVKRGVS
jgi:hypothetical protein